MRRSSNNFPFETAFSPQMYSFSSVHLNFLTITECFASLAGGDISKEEDSVSHEMVYQRVQRRISMEI